MKYTHYTVTLTHRNIVTKDLETITVHIPAINEEHARNYAKDLYDVVGEIDLQN